ncbi:MAG: carboxyl transferase domain-containing protein [Thermodesulfobacteriota bacterium]
MEEAIKDLEARKAKARLMGDRVYIDRQHALGHLTARERVEKLIDPGSFIELGLLDHSIDPELADKTPADGLIAGLAKVDGRPMAVMTLDKTVLAGTEGLSHMRKGKALHDFAQKRGLPIFLPGEGGGLRMPEGMGADGISERMMPWEMLRHGRRTPVLAAIMGDSFGGPTWSAVTADFAVMVKGACMAVSGPRMLEIATSEIITEEELGGWKIQAEVTGQVDALAENDEECLDLMRRFFSYMPLNADEETPHLESGDDPCRRLDEVIRIVPDNLKRAYDMRRLVRLIVDKGSFFELRETYGRALVTGLGRLAGRVVGLIANQPLHNAGASGPQECEKAIEFICLCDSYNIPLVFLHDTPGFLVGSQAERGKIATKIMVWNQAVAWSTVPKLSVVVRKSIGAAYSNMCGPSMGSDFVVAWPIAQISFTGDEVGVNVVYGRQLAESAHPAEERQELLKQWAHNSSPYRAAGKHLLDDVIDPRDTRKFLCQALDYSCRRGVKSQRLLANWPTGF